VKKYKPLLWLLASRRTVHSSICPYWLNNDLTSFSPDFLLSIPINNFLSAG
jgi:hypothetical protein